MKSFFLIPLIAVVGCAGKTVKMTPDEVQAYLNKTPEVAKSFSENSGKSMVRQKDYCESSYTGPCWKVECIGSAKNLSETKCWKTPYEAFGISSSSNAPDQNTEQLLATCKATDENPVKRRWGCFDYFTRLQKNSSEKTDPASTQKLLKKFCDMKDVTCSRQHKKFGKGDLNTEGMRSSAYKIGVYQLSSKDKSKSTEAYELIILK